MNPTEFEPEMRVEERGGRTIAYMQYGDVRVEERMSTGTMGGIEERTRQSLLRQLRQRLVKMGALPASPEKV